MQLAIVDSRVRTEPQAAVERAAAARTERAAAAAPVADSQPNREERNTSTRGASIRPGLSALDPTINRHIAGTQQAIAFLDQAATQLQALRTELIERVSAARNGDGAPDTGIPELEQRLQRFGALWRERSSASGGTIDNQVEFIADGNPQRKFSVRGLTMANLHGGTAETLYVAVAGRTQGAAAVAIESDMTAQAIVQRFDRALAPSGIRAVQGADGEISFSVAESVWPNVRDGLAIKGEGRRFPTGAFNAARITPNAPAVRPEEWNVQNDAARRNTLVNVANAQKLVRDARVSAERALVTVAQRFSSRENRERLQLEAGRSIAFTQTFEVSLERGDYQALSAISPALRGMHRDRVTALLATNK